MRLNTRARAGLFALSTGAAVILGIVGARPNLRSEKPVAPRVSVQPLYIHADGYDTATLSIEASRSAGTPKISVVENPHGAVVTEIAEEDSKWQAHIRAGVVPGRIVLRIQFPNLPAATAELTAIPSHGDAFQDGTPDFLRLGEESDRRAFRRWFTYLAEEQYFQNPANRPLEINDCAALIRYAYREALRVHEPGWAEAARLPVVPSFGPVAKYQYPYTPVGAALFRVEEGPYAADDLSGKSFAQFADAQTLWRFNTHRIGRDLSRAASGDLLFFRQNQDHLSFHSMIYLGESQLRKDGSTYIVYHTGGNGADPGEIRRLTTQELLRFPQPEWRPVSGNSNFLGVFRWNILRKASENDNARF